MMDMNLDRNEDDPTHSNRVEHIVGDMKGILKSKGTKPLPAKELAKALKVKSL